MRDSVIPIVAGTLRRVLKGLKMEIGRIGKQSKNRDLNTQKTPQALRKLVVAQIPMKMNNNNNNNTTISEKITRKQK